MAADPPFSWPSGRCAAVSLSFDDARPSQLDRGLPILNAYGVKATFYASLGPLAQRIDDWRRAVAQGHEIGNHSVNHPCSGNFPFARAHALEDYTWERMEAELTGASDVIERLVGVRSVTFAYPCGQTFIGRGEGTRSYIPLVAKHFIVGRAAFNEIHNDPTFCDLAHVTSLDGDDRPFEYLKGLVDAALATGGWLILMGHDVGEGGHQVVRADALEALCRYLQDPATGVWVDTVAAVGKYVRDTRTAS